MAFRTLDQLAVEGKRVFVRVDFNVPLEKSTGRTITSDTRIRMSMPSIRALLDRGASVILASHLGRPKGNPNSKMSLAPVAARLSELLGQSVSMAPDCVGPEVQSMAQALQPGQALLLENLRFHSQEEANDSGFARELSELADVYVNDAFGAAHRAHASTAGITEFMPERAAGLLMERELEYLSMATSAPRRPYIAIIGGAKISGKIDVIRNLLNLADYVLIGGAMTYTFQKALGFGVGASLVEEEKLDLATALMEQAGDRLVLPVDHVVAEGFSDEYPTDVVTHHILDHWMGLDIGPETVKLYESVIEMAKMVVWNGPMGVFEVDRFATGTLAIARAVEAVSDSSVTIVGGGDSEQAIRAAGVGDRISHISTGGGASLEFLGGKTLPGVASLG